MRRQLVIGIGGQVALTTLVCAIALGTLMSIGSDVQHSSHAMVAELEAVRTLRRGSEKLVGDARALLITGDRAYAADIEREEQALAEAMRSLRQGQLFDGDIASADAQLRHYAITIGAVVNERDRVKALDDLDQLFEQRLAPRRLDLDRALERLEENATRRVEAAAADQGRLAHASSLALFLACATTIVLCVVVGILVARRLARQFDSIERATHEASDAAFARRQLLDVVAHDLKSPLNTIVLGLDVLRETKPDLPCMEPLENAARRMCRLVDDLLDTGRAHACTLVLEPRRVECNSVLAMAREMFTEPFRRSGVNLSVRCADGLAMVADRDRVLQILANLMGNALRVSERGTTVTLEARRGVGGVRISVGDAGPGIPPDQVGLIFEAYRQGPASGVVRGSLGLGLYISKTLVEAHGGKIGVDSVPGRGSTFWFELPERATDPPS